MPESTTPSPSVRRHVIISGLVQGVWFRDSCSAEAERLGVRGIVRNREDGTVEGDFEGPAEVVDALVSWCEHGPEKAEVSDVSVVDALPIGYRDFRII